MDSKNSLLRALRHIGMVGQLGLGLVGPAVVFTLIGVAICHYTDCGGWLIALLFVLGLLGGIVATIRTVFAYQQITKKEEERIEDEQDRFDR